MAEIDAVTLIAAMKRRPALYNKQDINYYSHKKQKAKLWTEVCREVFPNFDNLKPQRKVEYGHEVQKRWKSLRTCFTRELAKQKREELARQKNGGPIKKRKRYEHFHLLTFILDGRGKNGKIPSKETDETDESDDSDDPLDVEDAEMPSSPMDIKEAKMISYSEASTSHHEADYEPSFPLSLYERKNEPMEEKEYEIGIEPLEKMYDRGNKGIENNMYERNENLEDTMYERRNETLEHRTMEMLKEIKKDEADEDRQFLLSLVPSFRKLQLKQKFEARIEILRVLQDITFKED